MKNRASLQKQLDDVIEAENLLNTMPFYDDTQWNLMHEDTDDDKQLKQHLGDDWHCQCNPLCGRPLGHAGNHDNFFAKQMLEADELDSHMDMYLLPWGAQI